MPVTLEIPNKPSLRPDETARLLGCSNEHVRHLVEEGSLAALDIKSVLAHKPSLRIVTQSLAAFMQKRRTL